MASADSKLLPIVETDRHGGHAAPATGRVRRWTWAHRLTALAFLVLFALEPSIPPSIFVGNWNAARWFDRIDVIDPLAFCETVLASQVVSLELFLGVLPTALMAVVLGRVFCSWVCPLGLVLEGNAALAERLGRHRRSLRHSPRRSMSHGWKYAVLVGCLAGSLLAGVPLFASVSPINLPYILRNESLMLALAVPAVLMAIEWWFPRVFCRSVCPLGALHSLLGRRALFRVRITGDDPLRCQRCTRDCPMGIDVMRDHVLAGHHAVTDPECTRCGSCTDRCLGAVLKMGWKATPPATSTAAPEHRRNSPRPPNSRE